MTSVGNVGTGRVVIKDSTLFTKIRMHRKVKKVINISLLYCFQAWAEIINSTRNLSDRRTELGLHHNQTQISLFLVQNKVSSQRGQSECRIPSLPAARNVLGCCYRRPRARRGGGRRPRESGIDKALAHLQNLKTKIHQASGSLGNRERPHNGTRDARGAGEPAQEAGEVGARQGSRQGTLQVCTATSIPRIPLQIQF